VLDRVAQRRLITVCAQPANHAHGQIGQVRMVPKWLAIIDVGQVHLDERNTYGRQRIAYRHAGMRISGRIDDQKVRTIAARGLNPRHQLAASVCAP